MLSARGFVVARTEGPGDALELGRAAGEGGASEVADHERPDIRVRERALDCRVGPGYDPESR